jgi:hypothetical protein
MDMYKSIFDKDHTLLIGSWNISPDMCNWFLSRGTNIAGRENPHKRGNPLDTDGTKQRTEEMPPDLQGVHFITSS